MSLSSIPGVTIDSDGNAVIPADRMLEIMHTLSSEAFNDGFKHGRKSTTQEPFMYVNPEDYAKSLKGSDVIPYQGKL